MTLEEARNSVGRRVKYTPFKGCDDKDLEYGVITSVSDLFVSVRYGSDVNSKSTKSYDLELEVC
jgi:hypothetical protein